MSDPTRHAIRAIKAEAWDEGYTRGFYDREVMPGEVRDASEGPSENPYLDSESTRVTADVSRGAGTPRDSATVSARGPIEQFRTTQPDDPMVAALDSDTTHTIERLEGEVAEVSDGRYVIDAAHIEHQREWSTATFGPRDKRGPTGPLAHIRKEVEEVAADPTDLGEWVDVIILAFDGAWRAGHEPQDIIDGVKLKQAINEARSWPDWRGVSADQAIEHIRLLPDAVDAKGEL